jgi:hypothetical protein
LIGETQSILGLIKPCLEKAAAGRLWAEEGQEKGEGFSCVNHEKMENNIQKADLAFEMRS